MPTSADRRRSGCALCGKPASPAHKPFCSQGCRDRDLLQWLGEGYRVPGPAAQSGAGEYGEDGLDSDA